MSSDSHLTSLHTRVSDSFKRTKYRKWTIKQSALPFWNLLGCDLICSDLSDSRSAPKKSSQFIILYNLSAISSSSSLPAFLISPVYMLTQQHARHHTLFTQTSMWIHINMASTHVKLCFHWLLQPLLWLARVCSHPCVHANTHKHWNTVFAVHALHWAVSLASSLSTVSKGQRWPQLGITSLMFFCSSWLYVLCRCDDGTTLISWCFPYIKMLYTLLLKSSLFFFNSPLLASSSFPLSVASMLPLFFWFLPPTVLLVPPSHPPSVLLAQIDRTESLVLFIFPSEIHIVSQSSLLSAALYVFNKAGNRVQYRL